MINLSKSYFINHGIKETKILSINIVDEVLLKKSDYVVCVSGSKVDKSEVFEYYIWESAKKYMQEILLFQNE